MPATTSDQTVQSDQLVVVGRLGAPYGVRGWLQVRSFTQPPENLFDYAPWQLSGDAAAVSAFAAAPVGWQQWRPHKQAFVVLLNGVDNRNAIEALRGVHLQVPKSVFPPAALDEYYWQDLEGCVVYGDQGELGKVRNLIETGAHDVLVVVDAHRGEHLIPFADRYVSQVDLRNRRIQVQWQADW